MLIDALADLLLERFQVGRMNQSISVKRRVHSHELVVDDLPSAVQLVERAIAFRVIVPRSCGYRDRKGRRQHLLDCLI